jgi:ABC-2 type transport system permease protein
MKETLLVMAHEIRLSLRRKAFIVIAFGMPLLLGLIALLFILIGRAAPAETAETTVTTEIVQGYVDQAGLISALPAGMPPGRLLAYGDEAAAQNALEANKIQGYFIVPADYLSGGQLIYVTGEYTPFGNAINRQGIEWALVVNLLGGAEQANAIWQPLNLEVTTIPSAESASTVVDENNWLVEMFPTLMVLLMYMVIILPAGMLVNAVTDEKKNRVMEVLLTSISPRQFITGKILALGVLGLAETAVWLGVFWAVARFGGQSLNIPPGFTIPPALIVWVLVYGLLGYAIYGVLLAGLGALVPDIKDARSASTLLMAPLIVAYMFMVAVVETPNSAAALVLSLFPLTAPIGMIGRMTATTVPLWQLVLSAGLQLLTGVLLLRLVARMFRAQTLLSGQPFTVRRYFDVLLARAS